MVTPQMRADSTWEEALSAPQPCLLAHQMPDDPFVLVKVGCRKGGNDLAAERGEMIW